MSRRPARHLGIALVAALASAVPFLPARAQEAAEKARVARLLARAQALSLQLDTARLSRARHVHDQRRGRLMQSGAISAVFWEAVPGRRSQVIVRRADSILQRFAVIPESLIAGTVVVQVLATDTATLLRTPDLGGRRKLQLDWDCESDSVTAGDRVAAAMAGVFQRTLDSTWQAWLPPDLGIVWSPETEGQWAMGNFTETPFARGRLCLGGNAKACRQFLGLDRAADPVTDRYDALELRQRVRDTRALSNLGERADCLDGNDAACAHLVRSAYLLNPIPAGAFLRSSVVRAVWTLYGPDVVRAALQDTVDGPGARLARAAGVSEDSLVTAWRAWTLSRGRPDRVHAGIADLLPAVFAAALVLYLATRSGRWR